MKISGNRVTKQLHQENFVHIKKITFPQIHRSKNASENRMFLSPEIRGCGEWRWLGGGSSSAVVVALALALAFLVGLQNPDFFNVGKIDEIVLIINIIIIILK
jgi:hypothetical protein